LAVEDIISAAKNGDDFAILMLERTGVYLGAALASVINLLNVDRIVLGGFAADAGELLLGPIKARAREASFGPSFSDVTFVSGELGENAAAIGAALLSE
jgi:glucokinase